MAARKCIVDPLVKISKPERLAALKDLADCAIHGGRLVYPKQLPCSHAFCLDCLVRWQEQSSDSRSFSCPLCRHVVNCDTPGSIKALPSAIAHRTVAEYLFPETPQPGQPSSVGDELPIYSRTQLVMLNHCRYRVIRLPMDDKDRIECVAPIINANSGRLVSVLVVDAATSSLICFSCVGNTFPSGHLVERVEMPPGICRIRCLRLDCGEPSGQIFYAIAELQAVKDGSESRQAVVRLRLQNGCLSLLGKQQYPPGVELSDLQIGGPGREVVVALPSLCAVDLLQESNLSDEISIAPPRRLCLGDGLRPRRIAWADVGRRLAGSHRNRKRERLLWVACPDAGALVLLDVFSSKTSRVPPTHNNATSPSGPLTSAGPDSRMLVADVNGSDCGANSDIWWARDRGQVLPAAPSTFTKVVRRHGAGGSG